MERPFSQSGKEKSAVFLEGVLSELRLKESVGLIQGARERKCFPGRQSEELVIMESCRLCTAGTEGCVACPSPCPTTEAPGEGWSPCPSLPHPVSAPPSSKHLLCLQQKLALHHFWADPCASIPRTCQALESDSLPLALTQPCDNYRVRATPHHGAFDGCYYPHVTFMFPFVLHSLMTSSP